jgi:hypothetical protein
MTLLKDFSTCPECGSNIYFAQNFERVRDHLHLVRQAFERQASEFAVERARWCLKELEELESRKSIHRKVQKQRAVIVRLENKLRALGKRPHEPEEEKSNGDVQQ